MQNVSHCPEVPHGELQHVSLLQLGDALPLLLQRRHHQVLQTGRDIMQQDETTFKGILFILKLISAPQKCFFLVFEQNIPPP